MNITKVLLVTPVAGDDPIVHVTLNLIGSSRTDPFVLTGWTGLDAEDIIQQVSGYVGEINFYDMTLKPRVVSLNAKLNPNYGDNITVGDLRDTVYKAISQSPDATLELQFYNDTTYIASLTGRLSKVENTVFTAEPECKITFECSDPFLRSDDYITLIVGVDFYLGGDDHPIWTDSLSNAPHGYKMALQTALDFEQLIITSPNGSVFTVTNSFTNLDVIYISSEYNDRKIYIMRDGSPIYLTDKLESGSVWPIMYPGENNIVITTDINNLVLALEISYRTAYWGV